jgi:D-lactate dehydrogenase
LPRGRIVQYPIYILMKVFVYSAHPYDQPALQEAASGKHELLFTDQKLRGGTAHLAIGCQAVSIFTSDDASSLVLEKLYAFGIRYIALRSVGFDHVDLNKAAALGIRVANVPEYSPYSVAEHAVAMLMAMNRKIVESQLLMHLQDFRLDTLKGYDIHDKTVGIIGTGKIGMAFARIMHGFGTTLIGVDPVPNPDAIALGLEYVSLEELLQRSNIISLHCPLNRQTKYLLAKQQFDQMKKGCVLINTSRGGLVKTEDLLTALENKTLGAACLDVYENEKGLFFEDHRRSILKDFQFTRLRSFTNVLITGHQAFLTEEAVNGIADTTISNLDYWQRQEDSPNELGRKPDVSTQPKGHPKNSATLSH